MADQNTPDKDFNPGEQGRASYTTGSTTQGGSNFGQGSSHLGGETYQQGDSSNEGANYRNETNKLGNSTTGTNAEGASSPDAGVGSTNQAKDQSGTNNDRSETSWSQEEKRTDPHHGETDDEAHKLFEGDQRNTSLGQSSNMEEPEKRPGDMDAGHARGWSDSTLNDNNQ